MADEFGTFSIRVVDEDGHGVNGAKVSLAWWTLIGEPPAWDREFTDSDGWATFQIMNRSLETISINDEIVAEGLDKPDDGDTLSFTEP